MWRHEKRVTALSSKTSSLQVFWNNSKESCTLFVTPIQSRNKGLNGPESRLQLDSTSSPRNTVFEECLIIRADRTHPQQSRHAVEAEQDSVIVIFDQRPRIPIHPFFAFASLAADIEHLQQNDYKINTMSVTLS